MGVQKIIVVTGCTKGIGKAVSIAFANAGYQVVGCARNLTELAELKQELLQINPTAQHVTLPCDVSKREEIEEFINEVKKVHPRVDVLVNNAGVFKPGKLLTEEEGILEHLLDTNIVSAYHLTRGFLPAMLAKKEGHIFNICSIASLQAYEAGASYTISKFGLLGFSKQLRQETMGSGVKVTSVMPGATLTSSWAGVDLPSSRFIQPEDVAQTILSICELSSSADVEEVVIRPQQGDI